MPRCGDDRHQAGGESSCERPAARPDLRHRPRPRRPRAAARVATPPARLAGARGIRCRRAVCAGAPTPRRALHPGPHRWGRGLAPLARGSARRAQCVRRSLGERCGCRDARGVSCSGRRRAAALGHRPHDGHRMGQAALPRAPALPGGARPGEMEKRGGHLPARRVPVRLMRIDVNVFLGAYPYRRVPGTSPDAVLRAMERVGIDEAWATHLPGLFWQAPAGERLAVRDDHPGAAPQAGAGSAPGLAGMGGRGRGGGRPRRTRGAVRPDLFRARSRGRGDARARGRVRRGAAAPAQRRALGGRAPAAPQRSSRGAPRGRAPGTAAEPRQAAPRRDARRPRARRGGAFRLHPRGSRPRLVGHLLDLGAARGPPRDAARHRRSRAVRVRNGAAAPDPGERRGEARSPGPPRRATHGDRVWQRSHEALPLTARPPERLAARLEWGLVPAVPVPFRDGALAEDAQGAYALWMAGQQVGGVAYDNQTLHAILAQPGVIGIKVATLDSVMTFQRLAGLIRDHPEKLLITGEDRFFGYSLTMGARAALVGMGAALTNLQVGLIEAFHAGDFAKFVRLSAICDRFAAATFIPPMEGYVRRVLWALAADGVIPDDACDDPWGPPLTPAQPDAVRLAVP